MQKITTFLWYDHEAEEAAKFYTSLFKDSEITGLMKAGEQVMGVNFKLAGQEYIALNGGPGHPFSDATSLYVNCKDQAEVDDLWAKLTADGGEESRCGWLKDKYGLSWQIIPEDLPKLISNPDPAKANAAMQAMLGMSKINIQALKDAAA